MPFAVITASPRRNVRSSKIATFSGLTGTAATVNLGVRLGRTVNGRASRCCSAPIFGRSGLTRRCSGSAEHRREELKNAVVARGRPVNAWKAWRSMPAARAAATRIACADLRSRHGSSLSSPQGPVSKIRSSFGSATLRRTIRLPPPRRGRTRQGFQGRVFPPMVPRDRQPPCCRIPTEVFMLKNVSSRFLRCRVSRSCPSRPRRRRPRKRHA